MPPVEASPHSPGADAALGAHDLGPLAWVLVELRKTLESAVKSVRRFARDAVVARESDLASLDAAPLRIVRQQLHQASGALEMVGLPQPAVLLRGLEAALQRYVQRPELCDEAVVGVIERSSFALIEYLEHVLAGKSVSAVALFPQYRDVQALVGAARVHPADLWSAPAARGPALAALAAAPLAYGVQARERLDKAVLRLVRRDDLQAAAEVQALCLGFAAAQTDARQVHFWMLAAGFFEALARALVALDVYSKHVATRLLLQYAALARGEEAIAGPLEHELLFFCAQAGTVDALEPGGAPSALAAVRQAHALAQHTPADYEVARFGLFDPALLAQARKRIATATETWSALAGGDRNKLKPAVDQFSLVCESLNKLQPGSDALARALMRAVALPQRQGEPPSAALAMEVATAVLYLQASFEDLDVGHDDMAARSQQLAQRLENVVSGGDSEPLDPWMEELYRRVSDRQTMGSVVDELRATLAEAEKCMDQFFRQPEDIQVLQEVPARMQQMRGVLSVLGLDHAAQAVLHMRDTVERLLAGALAPEERPPVFEKLGNNLGALGFLIDMLSYQRTMARKLFAFDEDTQELRVLMGRSAAAPARAVEAAPASMPVPAPAAVPVSVAAPVERAPEVDDELRSIFLEEAREVVEGGLAATAALAAAPEDLSEQTTLRRAFHTLKGSSRMVGLNAFGEAAWAMEQVLNAWLAEQKPIHAPLLQLSEQTLQAFGQWADAIGTGQADAWSADVFRASADAMRLEGVLRPLALPQAAAESLAEPAAAPALPELPTLTPTEAAPEPEPLADFPDTVIDLDLLDVPALEAASDPQAGSAPALEMAEDIDFAEFERALQQEDVAAPAVPESEPAQEALQVPDLAAPGLEAGSLAEEFLLPAESVAAEPTSAEPSAELAGVPVNGVAVVEPFEAVGLPGVPDDAQVALSEALETVQGLDEPQREQEQAAAAEVPAAMPADEAPASLPEPGGEVPAGEAAEAPSVAEAVKVIGDLRIGIPLYTVYLNEADEWSRQLATALQEWALEQHKMLPDAAVALAHSLAGSSATVGFAALSRLARLLEHALQHAQLWPQAQPGHAAAFVDAAEEIRRLLHQFAAGFLKEPQPAPLQRLQTILDTEVVLGADDAMSAPAPLLAPAVTTSVFEEESIDADIDQIDTIDPDLFPIFEEEALELLPAMGAALRQWAQRPDNASARRELLRVLHTLKGSARLAGAMRLGEMAHRMESAVESRAVAVSTSQDVEPLLAQLDVIGAHFEWLRGAGARAVAAPLQAPSDAPVETPAAAVAPKAAAAAGVPALQVHAAEQSRTSLAGAAPVRQGAGPVVRVRAQLLDRLVGEAGEVMIARSRLQERMEQLRGSLGDLTANLDRLRQQLRDVEVQAESQMQSRLQLSKEAGAGFDPLEFDRFTRVQELTRMMAESVNDVATVQRTMQRTMESAEDDLVAQGRQARELQRDLLRTRMLEFEALSERLYAVVRQASKETGKQVKLDISGGHIEIDRGVLERMAPAFEHLLRNCVGHGIEPAQERQAAGKNPAGHITIALSHEGNDVSVEFHDDGAGLDLARIRARALVQGLIGGNEVLDDAQAAQLIFAPGFTTADAVTGLSGRGIGMDVVRSEVQALGGRIETSTTAGQGTAFRLVLPLTTAVTQVVMVRAGALTFGVPASLIEVVRRCPRADLPAAYTAQQFTEGGQPLDFYWAGALLQASAHSTEVSGRTCPVVVLRSAAQRIALHVDEVLGNQEAVVKNLGPQLARLPGLAGMSVLASGAVVLIYNPVALATLYGAQAHALMQPPAGSDAPLPGTPVLHEAQPAPTPLVLVVDDSITVRRVTQRLLQREGYRVALASDGLQALERLQDERPMVVLSDIEMPRMDGFDLVRNIRADAQLADLPVIMITSRIAQKHRDLALELGVDHYLGKPYSDDELLALIQHYVLKELAGQAL